MRPLIPEPAPRRPAPPRRCAAAFVAVVMTGLAVSAVARVAGLWTDAKVAASIAVVPAGPDLYLAYYHAGIEQYVFWNNVHNVAEPLRRADVLLLGSSHMQFDWPRETTEPFFARRGLRAYNLGFGYHEGSPFPLALIRRYDLRPKLVVCNLDPFFYPVPSGMAARAMAERPFDGFKYGLETRATFYAQRWLHRVVPPLAGQVPTWDEVYYRSVRDGSVTLVASTDLHAPVVHRSPPTWDTWQNLMPAARAFMAEMAARRVRVVFALDPVAPSADAIGFAGALGIPLLVPSRQDGLFTFDWSHLEHASAVRFSGAFYAMLGPYLDGHPLAGGAGGVQAR